MNRRAAKKSQDKGSEHDVPTRKRKRDKQGEQASSEKKRNRHEAGEKEHHDGGGKGPRSERQGLEEDPQTLPPSCSALVPAVADSPFQLKTISLYLPLSPISQLHPVEGLCAEHLSPLLLSYYPPFDGVIICYQNVRLSENPTDSTTDGDGPVMAKSIAEYGASFVWVTADFVLFRPRTGQWIDGWINLQNESHIGLVCFNLFNASIERQRLPRDWTWSGSGGRVGGEMDSTRLSNPEPAPSHLADEDRGQGFFIDGKDKPVDGQLRFRVKDIDTAFTGERGFLTIEGTLLDEATEKKVLEEELIASGLVPGNPPILWTAEKGSTIAQLLESVNDIIPLESDHWGLEDYAVDVLGFECLHFQEVKAVLRDGDVVNIKPLSSNDVLLRTHGGRLQISAAGRHLVDGVAFGRPYAKRPAPRPPVTIPPRKRVKAGDYDDDEKEDWQDGSGLALEGAVDTSHAVVRFQEGDNEESDHEMDEEEAQREAAMELAELSPVSQTALPLRPRRKRRQQLGSNAESGTGDKANAMELAEPSPISHAAFPRRRRRKRRQQPGSNVQSGTGDKANAMDVDLVVARLDDGEEEEEEEGEGDGRLEEEGDNDDPLIKNTTTTGHHHVNESDIDSDEKEVSDEDSDEDSDSSESDSSAPSVQPEDGHRSSESASSVESAASRSASDSDSSPSVAALPEDSQTDQRKSTALTAPRSKKLTVSSTAKIASLEPHTNAIAATTPKRNPPGEGSSATVKRNQRRRIRKRLLRLQNAGSSKENDDDVPCSEGGEPISDPGQMEAKKAELLSALVEHTAPAEEQREPSGSDKVDSLRRRVRLDVHSSRRMLISALGLDEKKVASSRLNGLHDPRAAALTNGEVARKAFTSNPSLLPGGTGVDAAEDDPSMIDDSWKEKIILSAVESSNDTADLRPPPFPFVQHWDSEPKRPVWKKKGKKRKWDQSSSKENVDPFPETIDEGGDAEGESSAVQHLKASVKRRRPNDTPRNETEAPSLDTIMHDKGGGLPDLDPESSAVVAALQALVDPDPDVAPTQDQPIPPPLPAVPMTEASHGEAEDDADLPPMPARAASLPALTPSDLRPGAIIAFKQLVMSAGWEPEISGYRTALVAETPAAASAPVRVVLAKRDRPQREKRFDEDGQRIYGKFEMPDDGADEAGHGDDGGGDGGDDDDDGARELSFSDLIEPKLLRAADILRSDRELGSGGPGVSFS
ncbi:MAG: hypothetical protein M1826_007108 [Phylliscum demangeonii]|nr:MAG: hypothetical protein M1826_007108 [Phylliscum demangeonii]